MRRSTEDGSAPEHADPPIAFVDSGDPAAPLLSPGVLVLDMRGNGRMNGPASGAGPLPSRWRRKPSTVPRSGPGPGPIPPLPASPE